MTPDPTPQPPDHGAAGFCTDHGQAPDDRTSTVARVLREHEWAGGETLNLGYYRTEATCICGIAYWGGDHDEDPSLADALIAHQAAAVVAALGKDGAGFWPALAGQNDRDAWTFMAERDAARAALDRVRALRQRYTARADDYGNRPAAADFRRVAADLRAALDPEERCSTCGQPMTAPGCSKFANGPGHTLSGGPVNPEEPR